MANLKVIVPLLNKRNIPVPDTRSKGNITGKVKQGFSFESVEQMTNAAGDWFKDRDGNWYWGGGLEKIVETTTTEPGEIKKSVQWFQDLKIENIWNTFAELGENATVAILDTGYDINNTELPTPLLSKLFVNNAANSATIQDKLWHGTFCASLIASRNKIVNIGLAPMCKILIGKVSLKGELKTVDIILDGIDWAIQSGAEIISISMGVPLTDKEQIDKLQERFSKIIQNKNILIFAACGDSDSGEIISKEFYPASLENCISVGTVKNNLLDNITVRSSKTIIHTLGIDIDSYMLDNVIEKQSGTSMSVPIVAGLMALAISFVKKRNNGQWNKDDVLQKLIQTSTNIDGFPNKKIINPLKFFQSL